jgi:hypothetical protein
MESGGSSSSRTIKLMEFRADCRWDATICRCRDSYSNRNSDKQVTQTQTEAEGHELELRRLPEQQNHYQTIMTPSYGRPMAMVIMQ